jgi:hypothetical protein
MYEEVALRHLYQVNGQFELRSEVWLQRLEEFIKTHKGKKYRLNPLDLFRSNAKSTPMVSTSKQSQEEQEDGFFCSELVAATY